MKKNLESQYYHPWKPTKLDAVPHEKNRLSSQVEKIILNIPDFVSQTIEQLERENRKLETIKPEILKECGRLPYHQKEIIFAFYIKGYKWERISSQLHYSPRQCRNIRNRALERLGKYFSENPAIANFPFPQK